MPVKVTVPRGLRLPTCMESPGCTHKLNDSSLMENPFVKRKGLPSKGSLLLIACAYYIKLILILVPQFSLQVSSTRCRLFCWFSLSMVMRVGLPHCLQH